jgi:flavocytochrome c
MKNADIIIIGSGFAGLSAAIEAALTGASIVVLEKMMAPGGNSIISDGGIAAPNTDYQEMAGIIDSPELMSQDMLLAGEGLNYPELVKVVTESAKNAFEWSRNTLGVRYFQRVDLFGGHSVPRCYTPEAMSGISLIKNQVDCLRKLKVPIYYGTFVKSLLRNNKGRIIGVEIIDGYRHNKPDQGTIFNIYASKAVIVCSGGFSSDTAFRQAQDPRLGNQVMSTNKVFATAEVLKECLHIGANAVQLSRIQLGPWASPDEKGYGAGPLFGDYVVIPYGLIVNPKSGQRFVNELCNRKMLAEALLRLNHPSIGLADTNGVEVADWDLTKALKKNVVKVFPTIQALATYYDINQAALDTTILSYNQMIKAGLDSDYQKPILRESKPIEKPPYYAMRMWPKVHYTMGGIQIDKCARVIGMDQQPIEGLLAAGEVTGGIHGACRLGSCAITECLVFGRIAGKTAVSVNSD